MITVKAARDLAAALITGADAAEANGAAEFDLLGESKDLLEKAQSELDAAIADAKSGS